MGPGPKRQNYFGEFNKYSKVLAFARHGVVQGQKFLVRAVPTRTAHTGVRCSFPFVAESCRCFVFHILSPLAPGRSSVAARCVFGLRLRRDALNLA